MSTTHDLVAAIKAELRTAGVTYADLADALGLSESSVKRMFAKGDMPLSRVDETLRVLKMDFAELAKKIADAEPLARELTEQQEAAVVADRKLLLVAICCLSQWTVDELRREYTLSEAECVQHLTRLDRLGIIELKPHNRYRSKVAKGFRWRPHGPVMRYFREHVAADYLSGGFDGEGELIMLVHGEIAPGHARTLVERLRRVGQDFAQAHIDEQKRPDDERSPYTLLVGMRSWLFAAFRDLKRAAPGSISPAIARSGTRPPGTAPGGR